MAAGRENPHLLVVEEHGARGFEAEFESYVARRGAWLGRCAHLLTRDADAALDLVQDTMAAAWRSRDRVWGAQDPERYLMRIMLNQFRGQHRRRSRRVVLELVPDHTLEGLGGGSVEGGISAVDESHTVAAALDALPDRQRAVIVLRYWADYDDAQIAEVLGCRRTTVRSLAARAFAKLKTTLEE